MQDLDKIKKNNRILSAMLLLSLVIIIVLVGIILLPKKSPSPAKNSGTTGEMILIDTPYCTMEYPAEFSERLKCVDQDENGIYSKIFYGFVSGQEVELFEVSFGAKEGAVFIGYILYNNTKQSIFVRSLEIDNTLPQDAKNTLYMMQEGINDVIDSIIRNPNYLRE